MLLVLSDRDIHFAPIIPNCAVAVETICTWLNYKTPDLAIQTGIMGYLFIEKKTLITFLMRDYCQTWW